MVRRGGDVQEDARAPQGLLAGGTARVPDVFADAQADEGRAELQDRGSRALAEVAILVEDAVVWQVAFVVAVQDPAAGDDGAGVVEIAVQVHEADRCRHPLRYPPGELFERVEVLPDNARPQQEVFGRVAGHGQLRAGDEVGALVRRPAQGVGGLLDVPPHVADDGVDLGESDLHALIISLPRASVSTSVYTIRAETPAAWDRILAVPTEKDRQRAAEDSRRNLPA